MGYVKCPRCDLNYMKEDEKYCDVCKAELKIGPALRFAALNDDDENDQVLCPVCKRNFMDANDEMCAECRERSNEKAAIEPDSDVDPDNDEEWRNYLDEDEKEAISNKGTEEEMISLSQLEEDEARELFDDEEEQDDDYYNDSIRDEDDDFDFPTGNADDYDDDDELEEEDVDEDD